MTDAKHAKELRYMIEVASLAIPKEREARARYLAAAARAPTDMSRRLFEEMAAQEEQHEAQLRSIISYLEDELAR